MKSWMLALAAATVTLPLSLGSAIAEEAAADMPWGGEDVADVAEVEPTEAVDEAAVEAALEIANDVANDVEMVAEESATESIDIDWGDEAPVAIDEAASADDAVANAVVGESVPVVEEVVVEEVVAEVAPQSVVSGSAAVGPNGKRGHIHVVAQGDTLWAISDSYLKTPWVWPAVWQDNADIENPHRIYPGDHIWISSTEMRKVTPAEAVEMVEAEQFAQAEPRGEAMPAALDEMELAVIDDAPAAMNAADDAGETLAMTAPAKAALRNIHLPGTDHFSFVNEEQLEGASSIVSSPSPRTWLAQGDRVVLGLGEGETEVGKRYDVFQNADPVRDPETGRAYGYHVQVLGWLEVKAVHGDSSTAEIRHSTDEIMRGASIIDREVMPAQVAIKPAPGDLEGRIIYLPKNRTQMSNMDYVFLDRGAVHGLEVGAEVMAYEAGGLEHDGVRGMNVRVPDHKVGDLVIVAVQPTTSVAFIVQSRRELMIGDAVRGASRTDVAAR